jgi:rare lipoprotein A
MKKISACFIALAILTNCSTKRHTGSAPVKGICRSCQPYQIRGIWYYPQTSYDYDETGIASWYGPGFHGRMKANGIEKFDQNDISAAHKTLPLPTVVRVTNTENGRSVVLVVDDRGPYVGERIIDLSIGAAKEIGSYSKGLANVHVEALKRHSQELSMYLARNGDKFGRDNQGRTWREVYLEEIAPKFDENAVEATEASKPVASKPDRESVPLVLPPQKDTQSSTDLNRLIETHSKDSDLSKLVDKHAVQTSSVKQQPVQAQSRKAFYIDLAAFVQKDNAQKLITEVTPLAHSSIKETSQMGQKFYTVRCGPYTSKEAAQRALSSLDVLGHNPKLIQE